MKKINKYMLHTPATELLTQQIQNEILIFVKIHSYPVAPLVHPMDAKVDCVVAISLNRDITGRFATYPFVKKNDKLREVE